MARRKETRVKMTAEEIPPFLSANLLEDRMYRQEVAGSYNSLTGPMTSVERVALTAMAAAIEKSMVFLIANPPKPLTTPRMLELLQAALTEQAIAAKYLAIVTRREDEAGKEG